MVCIPKNFIRSRDKRADALGEKWRSLWQDSMARGDKLEKEREHLKELRRLEGWTWDGWRVRGGRERGRIEKEG